MDFVGLNNMTELLRVFGRSAEKYTLSAEKYTLSPELKQALKKFDDTAKMVKEKLITNLLSDEIKEYLNSLREDENLSQEDFEIKYIYWKNACEHLGRSGWVITEYGDPNEVKEWYKLLQDGKEVEIYRYFTGDHKFVQKLVLEGLTKKYVCGEEKVYFERGLKYYVLKDYMTSAMYLVGLLEQRCKASIDFGKNRGYKKIFSADGFEKHLQDEYGKINSQLTKRFLFLEMYPSLIGFLNRLFVDAEYKFENGIEPPYINRNWLLHGKTTRDIEEYECFQLFNALSVLEFVCNVREKSKG